jgi:hypothetical protein
MAVDLVLFLDDRNHITVSTSTFTASSTAASYAIDNAREADLVRAWKPDNSAATNEHLTVDGGSTTWVGAGLAKAYCAISYDARGANQTAIELMTDSGDSAGGSFLQSKLTFSSLNTSEVSCAWGSFTISSTAKRYYRLWQFAVSGRSAGNEVTAKVLSWAMFSATGAIELSLSHPSVAVSPYLIRQNSRVGSVRTAGGVQLTNVYARTGQRFTVVFNSATVALWEELRDRIRAVEGMNRALYIQKEGLSNGGTSNFFMCRLVGADWVASRRNVGSYEVEMEFETEPWV